MMIRWEALTIDARDPMSLAQWWAQTLGWNLGDATADGVEVRPPDGRPPSLFFVHVQGPKPSKNRLHLDLYAEAPATAADELVARGATHANVGQPDDADWLVLRDPEGNEFCILDPR